MHFKNAFKMHLIAFKNACNMHFLHAFLKCIFDSTGDQYSRSIKQNFLPFENALITCFFTRGIRVEYGLKTLKKILLLFQDDFSH